MIKNLGKLAVAAGAVFAFGAQAQIANGSFEAPALTSGSLSFFSAGGTDWGYTTGNEFILNQGSQSLTAQDGVQYAQLPDAGDAIYTTFTTTVGEQYAVSYYTLGNGSASAVDSYGVQSQLSSTSFSTDWSGWKLGTLFFTAVSNTTKVYFEAVAPGTLLDNVSVSAVPEAETYAMLIAGLGVLGFVGRRRIGRQD